LSGDAGDELFGGYNRYFWGPRIWDKGVLIPHAHRRWIGTSVQAVPVSAWDTLSQAAQRAGLDKAGRLNRLGDKARKLAARLISAKDLDDVYWILVTKWPGGNAMVRGGGGAMENQLLWPGPQDELEDWLANRSIPPSNVTESSEE